MTDAPIKYVECAVTLEEVPTEISLTLSVSNCHFRCRGYHSAHLDWVSRKYCLISGRRSRKASTTGL